MFGSRTTGSSLSAGQSSAFGSGMGGSGMGGSGMGGQSGLTGLSGGLSGGSSQMGGQSGIGQSGGVVAGQGRRAGDFVGANSQQLTGRGFVGMDQATGATGTGQGMQGFGNGGMPGFGGRNFSTSQNQLGNAQGNPYGNGGGRVSIRTALTMSFESPPDNSRQFSSSLTKRLADLPAIHWRTPSQVEIQGRTAILRGVVATEHDRDLAERVVRLEAAVDQVQNQLVVASNSTKPAKSSGATPASPMAPR